MKAITPSLIAYLIIWLALIAAGREKLFHDDDTYWHIAVGREILQSGEFITADNYSCTRNGQPWIAHQWLGECGLAVIDRAAGWDGLLLSTTAALAALYGWIASRLLAAGLHGLVAALWITIAIAASANNLLIRPHMATLVLLGVVFGILSAVDHRRIGLAFLWWLVPIMLVWSNTHGGVIGGLGTIAIVFAGWTLCYWFGRTSPLRSPRDVLLLFCVGMLSCVTTIVTPYGTGTIGAWRRILAGDLSNLVIEHAPMNPLSPEGGMVVLLAILYLVVQCTNGRITVTSLIPLIWCWLSISRIRHAPLFAVVAMIATTEMLPHSRVGQWLGRRGFWKVPSVPPPTNRWWQPAIVVTVLVLITSAIIHNVGPSRGRTWSWARPHSANWPVELLPALQQYSEGGRRSINILNDEEYAGFLIYNCPEYKVFIDSRCELYGDDFLRQYVQHQGDPEKVGEWIAAYSLQAALVKKGSPLRQSLAELPGWQMESENPRAEFWVRMPSGLPANDQ